MNLIYFHQQTQNVYLFLQTGTLVVQYYSKALDGSTARFVFPNFPIICNDGSFKVKDLFVIDLNLETKCMVKAELDNQAVTPSQAVILLFFNTISANHVKIHALANWGVNVEPEQETKDAFQARNSLITVMYNYLGYKVFVYFFPFWKSLGLIDRCIGPALVSIL